MLDLLLWRKLLYLHHIWILDRHGSLVNSVIRAPDFPFGRSSGARPSDSNISAQAFSNNRQDLPITSVGLVPKLCSSAVLKLRVPLNIPNIPNVLEDSECSGI